MTIPHRHATSSESQKTQQALLRASEKARLLAEQTGTPFIVRPAAPASSTAPKHK